jgi:chromatin segregation and condensation protein Rec8/ScpA/Scc1 (kleisin family)
VSLGVAGCPHDKVHAKMPKIIPPVPVNVEPLIPPDIHGEEPTDTALAMIPEYLPTPPPERTHASPPRKPAADATVTPKPAAPMISPNISPADQAAYQHRIEENLDTAQRNLQQAKSRQLNSAQQDMAEKVKTFIQQAQEAMQASDWTRAQNLAQKAQVLSAELIGSF